MFRAAAPNNDILTELSGCARATAKQLRAWVRDARNRTTLHRARQGVIVVNRDGNICEPDGDDNILLPTSTKLVIQPVTYTGALCACGRGPRGRRARGRRGSREEQQVKLLQHVPN